MGEKEREDSQKEGEARIKQTTLKNSPLVCGKSEKDPFGGANSAFRAFGMVDTEYISDWVFQFT